MLLPQGAPVTLIDDVGKMVVALLFTGAGCWTLAQRRWSLISGSRWRGMPPRTTGMDVMPGATKSKWSAQRHTHASPPRSFQLDLSALQGAPEDSGFRCLQTCARFRTRAVPLSAPAQRWQSCKGRGIGGCASNQNKGLTRSTRSWQI